MNPTVTQKTYSHNKQEHQQTTNKQKQNHHLGTDSSHSHWEFKCMTSILLLLKPWHFFTVLDVFTIISIVALTHTKCSFKMYHKCQILLNSSIELLFLLYQNMPNHKFKTFNTTVAWNVYLLYSNMYHRVPLSSSDARPTFDYLENCIMNFAVKYII